VSIAINGGPSKRRELYVSPGVDRCREVGEIRTPNAVPTPSSCVRYARSSDALRTELLDNRSTMRGRWNRHRGRAVSIDDGLALAGTPVARRPITVTLLSRVPSLAFDDRRAFSHAVDGIEATLAATGDGFPYVGDAETGEWTTTADGNWCGGHWVGLLWLAHEHTGDDRFADAARTHAETVLASVEPRSMFYGMNAHYAGFRAYDLTGDDRFRTAGVREADATAEFFHRGARQVPLGTQPIVAPAENFRGPTTTAARRGTGSAPSTRCTRRCPFSGGATVRTGGPRVPGCRRLTRRQGDRLVRPRGRADLDVGRAGIPYMGYNWMPNGVWRSSTTHRHRGEAETSEIDTRQLERAPPTHDVDLAEAEMWEHYERFLDAVLPVAEEAGATLCLHPDDPPVESIGGVPRLFRNFENFERAMDLVPSDNHALQFCLGNWSAMGADLEEVVQQFGDRDEIADVHFQTVSGTLPKFDEIFIDQEGYYDPHEIIAKLDDVGFSGRIIPGHVPKLEGDGQYLDHDDRSDLDVEGPRRLERPGASLQDGVPSLPRRYTAPVVTPLDRGRIRPVEPVGRRRGFGPRRDRGSPGRRRRVGTGGGRAVVDRRAAPLVRIDGGSHVDTAAVRARPRWSPLATFADPFRGADHDPT
jgi:sugar phosphate isomerase/epimerase